MTLPRLLTTDEVATYLHRSKQWVYLEARAGRIPAVKVGKGLLFKESDIAALIGVSEDET
jgi:excisionase family DNA binding protein